MGTREKHTREAERTNERGRHRKKVLGLKKALKCVRDGARAGGMQWLEG